MGFTDLFKNKKKSEQKKSFDEFFEDSDNEFFKDAEDSILNAKIPEEKKEAMRKFLADEPDRDLEIIGHMEKSEDLKLQIIHEKDSKKREKLFKQLEELEKKNPFLEKIPEGATVVSYNRYEDAAKAELRHPNKKSQPVQIEKIPEEEFEKKWEEFKKKIPPEDKFTKDWTKAMEGEKGARGIARALNNPGFIKDCEALNQRQRDLIEFEKLKIERKKGEKVK